MLKGQLSDSILQFEQRRSAILARLRSKQSGTRHHFKRLVFSSRIGTRFQADLTRVDAIWQQQQGKRHHNLDGDLAAAAALQRSFFGAEKEYGDDDDVDAASSSSVVNSTQCENSSPSNKFDIPEEIPRLVCSPLWICRPNNVGHIPMLDFEDNLIVFVALMHDTHNFTVDQALYFLMSSEYDFGTALKMAEMQHSFRANPKGRPMSSFNTSDEITIIEFSRHIPFDVELMHKKLKNYTKKELVHQFYLLQPIIAKDYSFNAFIFQNFDLIPDKIQIAHYLDSAIYSDISIKCLNCKEYYDYYLYCNVCYHCWTLKQQQQSQNTKGAKRPPQIHSNEMSPEFLAMPLILQDKEISATRNNLDICKSSLDQKRRIYERLTSELPLRPHFTNPCSELTRENELSCRDRKGCIWQQGDIISLIMAHSEFDGNEERIRQLIQNHSPSDINSMLELLSSGTT